MRLPLLALAALALWTNVAIANDATRPNILWITSEDHGPHVGCYGDKFATTPNADALAAKGLRYRVCWSNAPVCAPARTTLITGLYAYSIGGHHMRSMAPLPKHIKLFPHYLREAGYYCTNNSKEDYNVAKPEGTWDVSSNKAHWRNRGKEQPFFAVFNSTKSHESQIRTRPHTWQHDPAKVRVPAYHPDTKEVREDWAQYYDQVTAADADAGKVLEQLAQDGLTENTIIFHFADHGSGLPRNKRFAGNSGLQVPFIVYFPEQFKHLAPREYKAGGVSDRLVSFVDFAPTVLSIAGIQPLDWMQGQAFAGKYATEPRPFVYGFRDRMDERYDFVRSVRDERYVYIRNFLPHLPHGQHVSYMFQTPTTQVWKRLFDQSKLPPEQAAYWTRRAPEELYDLQSDPDEVHNLASQREHQATLLRFREQMEKQLLATGDLGLLPESEIHRRSKELAPYELGQTLVKDGLTFIEIKDAAQMASEQQSSAADLRPLLLHDDAAVRYWGVMGLLMREREGVAAELKGLRPLLKDSAPCVRIAAAEALARYGEKSDFESSLRVLVGLAAPQDNGPIVPIAALNAIDALGPAASPAKETLATMKAVGNKPAGRYTEYAGRLLKDINAKLNLPERGASVP